MSKIRLKILAVAVIASSLAMSGALPQWEALAPASAIELVADEADAEVRDGAIIVSCSKSTTVKVFSIVGQLISTQTLQPGTWRLKIAKRGIYILRMGDKTLRVTL